MVYSMIQRSAISVTLSVFLLFLIYSCSGPVNDDSQTVIASIGNSQLTLEQAFTEIPEFILREDTLTALQMFMNQWIEREVAAEHARRTGIHRTSGFRDRVYQLERELMVQFLKEIILSNNKNEISVSVEEAQNYYMTYRDQFTFDEPYLRFRLISAKTRTEAENANRELISGQEWEEILNRYSVNPDLQLQHSMQFWPYSLAASEIPPLQQNLRTMGITERSPVIYHDGLFHLAQVMEIRTEGEYPDLEWLIPQIQEWLSLEKSRRIINAYLRNLYLQAEVNNEIDRLSVTEIENLISK